MRFFRAYIAPLLIVLTFLFAMVAVSARIFLPSDMMAPAPLEDPVAQAGEAAPVAAALEADLLPDLSMLVHGQPDLAS
ncbi:MAG: hypothetical protein VKJ09_01635 [Leptolyngbya sp.]|nr:hypothetical protein [Leptolyngbya sp.]